MLAESMYYGDLDLYEIFLLLMSFGLMFLLALLESSLLRCDRFSSCLSTLSTLSILYTFSTLYIILGALF